MPQESLKQKAAAGMIWTAIQKYSGMVVGFISSIILARLLLPDDYGAIGMLAIFMSLAEVFIDAGFDSALIQKKEPTQTDYSTVFYFNLVMSGILYLFIYFFAPLIANFYRMPILCKILRIQGLILFIYAFSIIQRNQIRKNLRFKKLAKITITTSIISLIVTVFLAYMGFGVWALVIQHYVAALVPCIFFWLTTEWHPSLEYSWKSFKELFSFGSFMFLNNIFTTFSERITGLLVGRWFNPATMGYFSKASSTTDYATLSISGVVLQTTYPLYAKVQDDKVRMANMVKNISSTLAYLTVPLLSLMILVAKPIFVLLYTERWLPCVPYFRLLCLAGMVICLFAVNNQTISAIGKSKVTFTWTVVKQIISISLQLVGIIVWGMMGLLVGKVLSAWISYFVNITLVSKYIGYKNYQQLKDLFPIFFISALAVVGSYFITLPLELSLYVDGVVKVIVFVLIYGGWSLVFKPEAFKYSLSILNVLKSKKNKK